MLLKCWQIENKKLDFQVQSKIGSLSNIKHKPGGGDKKIFDDKDYLRQMGAPSTPSLDNSQVTSRHFHPYPNLVA